MISANKARHTFGLTPLSGKTGRGGTYLPVFVNELRAAKHENFSHPHGESVGESVLHILLQVGARSYDP